MAPTPRREVHPQGMCGKSHDSWMNAAVLRHAYCAAALGKSKCGTAAAPS